MLNFDDKPFWNRIEKSYINSGNSTLIIQSYKTLSTSCGSGFIRKVNLYHMRSALVCTGDTTSSSRNNFYITLELWLFNLGGSIVKWKK